MGTVRKKFDTLQETSERYSMIGNYENFVTTQKESAVECVPTKLRTKCNVLRESQAIREKNLRTRKMHPNLIEIQQSVVCRNLWKPYQKEQLQYIQGQINKLRNLIWYRQSWSVRQRVNEVIRRKCRLIVKNAASQAERLHQMKEHFKNMVLWICNTVYK